MDDAQKMFRTIQELKKKKKEISASMRDALYNSADLQDVKEKIKQLQQKKKIMEQEIKKEFEVDLARIDRYKKDIADETEKLSAAALARIAKGEMLVVVDEYEKTYDPILIVKFRKSENQDV